MTHFDLYETHVTNLHCIQLYNFLFCSNLIEGKLMLLYILKNCLHCFVYFADDKEIIHMVLHI
jgi:hypothetical protein